MLNTILAPWQICFKPATNDQQTKTHDDPNINRPSTDHQPTIKNVIWRARIINQWWVDHEVIINPLVDPALNHPTSINKHIWISYDIIGFSMKSFLRSIISMANLLNQEICFEADLEVLPVLRSRRSLTPVHRKQLPRFGTRSSGWVQGRWTVWLVWNFIEWYGSYSFRWCGMLDVSVWTSLEWWILLVWLVWNNGFGMVLWTHGGLFVDCWMGLWHGCCFFVSWPPTEGWWGWHAITMIRMVSKIHQQDLVWNRYGLSLDWLWM